MVDYPQCNGNTFTYHRQSDKNNDIFYIVVGLTSAVLVYLLVRMFKLCWKAFSYSNFHIHQAYKFYAVATISFVMILVARKSQMDYLIVKGKNRQYSAQTQEGYRIINQLIGILSICSVNEMYALNGYTWLMVALRCDYILEKQQRSSFISNQSDSARQYDYEQRILNSTKRKVIRFFKVVTLYVFIPVLGMLSIYGTLKQEEVWCKISTICTVCATVTTLSFFLVASVVYLWKKRADQTSKRYVKVLLAYVSISMAIRLSYFIYICISAFGNKQDNQMSQILYVFYTVFCSLLPVVAISILAEYQLKNQKYSNFKGSEIFLFKSTLI